MVHAVGQKPSAIIRRMSFAKGSLNSEEHSFKTRVASMSGPVPLSTSILSRIFPTCELRTKINSSATDLVKSNLNSFVSKTGKLNLLEKVRASRFAFSSGSRTQTASAFLRAGIISWPPCFSIMRFAIRHHPLLPRFSARNLSLIRSM